MTIKLYFYQVSANNVFLKVKNKLYGVKIAIPKLDITTHVYSLFTNKEIGRYPAYRIFCRSC